MAIVLLVSTKFRMRFNKNLMWPGAKLPRKAHGKKLREIVPHAHLLSLLIAGDAGWELELTKVSAQALRVPELEQDNGLLSFMLLPWAHIFRKTCLEYRLTTSNQPSNVLSPWTIMIPKMGNETLCCQLEKKTFGQRDRNQPTYFCRFQSRASTRKRDRNRSLALTLDIEESHWSLCYKNPRDHQNCSPSTLVVDIFLTPLQRQVFLVFLRHILPLLKHTIFLHFMFKLVQGLVDVSRRPLAHIPLPVFVIYLKVDTRVGFSPEPRTFNDRHQSTTNLILDPLKTCQKKRTRWMKAG